MKDTIKRGIGDDGLYPFAAQWQKRCVVTWFLACLFFISNDLLAKGLQK